MNIFLIYSSEKLLYISKIKYKTADLSLILNNQVYTFTDF